MTQAASVPSRCWLITGVSSGFGRALAEAALARGDAVVGTLRQPEQARAFAALAPGRAHGLVLDVTDRSAIAGGVRQAIALLGHVDVLVNNAGYGLFAAVEETSDEEARHIMETNFFGLLAVTQALLPHLRERGGGHVINLSSLAGIMGLPGCGLYCASKFAVEGLTESLAIELAPHGVHVTLVEPGGFRTNFGGGSMRLGQREMPAYTQTAGRTRQGMAGFSQRALGDPAKAAAALLALVDMPQPPQRVALGADAVGAVRRKAATLTEQMDACEPMAIATAVTAPTAAG